MAECCLLIFISLWDKGADVWLTEEGKTASVGWGSVVHTGQQKRLGGEEISAELAPSAPLTPDALMHLAPFHSYISEPHRPQG